MSWFLCRHKRPQASLRLYCFAHGGGSVGEYLRWADALPGVEVIGVQLPGRGSRLGEPLFSAAEPLVEALVRGAAFAPPFVFFGHSLGALLAFETARALRAAGKAQPRHLIVSAVGSPGGPLHVTPVSHLDDTALIEALERSFGMPGAELRADAELRELVLPPMRADFTIVETYRYVPGPPLTIPLTVVGGTEDQYTESELADWRRHTTGPFALHVLPGDHFYFRTKLDTLLAILRGATAAAAR